ncbi:hypothetical protein ACFSL6_23755 [Paenibacillus thailandensis]|uniref:Uncharacterized protein n=1 Tax=Paenibacillus thailandensis TaxID=393250 RepID=A0ABW5R2Q4_9BACL
MDDKSVSISSKNAAKPDARRLVLITTVAAWIALAIGVVLCLFNLHEFNDRNVGLMVGIGFLVGSVFIYSCGMAVNMVEAYTRSSSAKDDDSSE